jgi:hypothetical protein
VVVDLIVDLVGAVVDLIVVGLIVVGLFVVGLFVVGLFVVDLIVGDLIFVNHNEIEVMLADKDVDLSVVTVELVEFAAPSEFGVFVVFVVTRVVGERP